MAGSHQKKKRDLTTLPYLLVETEEDKPDKDKTCTQTEKIARRMQTFSPKMHAIPNKAKKAK